MKILAIECSATPCSVAIIEDKKIIASGFVNVKLTHSQTLMPMVESVLSSAKTDFSDIEGFAVSAGPGSFTGVRIGISAIKGMAAAKKIPCVGVSTLRAMAENYRDTDCLVCAVMDARCNQVYNGIFDISDGLITPLCDDRALLCDELKSELEELIKKYGKDIIIVGDGTDVFYPFVENISKIKRSDTKKQFQNAVGVAFTALEKFQKGETISPDDLLPIYLRLPQAERELKNKKGAEK